jgi:colanic acid biosynthesis glycosyl transferase WcaI
MPRLIFVNRYFFPDHSATSQVLSDLAFHLAQTDRDVHIVTSTQIYDDPKAALPEHEFVKGVQVHRVPSTRFGRSSLAGRAFDYASFYRSVQRRLKEIVGRGDIVIAKTDPPLTSIVALAAARRNGAHLVNWLQDIYPETAVELNVPFIRGPVAAVLTPLRNRSLRHAMANVAVGDLMGLKLKVLGAPAETIHVIPNWCDDDEIKPVPHSDNPLRQVWGLQDKFVFGYSGNLGRAHEYDTVLAAAEQLREDPRIVFVMIGGGKRFEELEGIVKQRKLDDSFRFMSYQDQTILPYSLGVSDAHWLSLNPKLEGLIVPSKFYGIAAAGRPIIAIADRQGEVARIVDRHSCGIVIAPGDVGALVSALQRLSREPEMSAEMGQRARQMLEERFSRKQGLASWQALVNRLIDPRPDLDAG